MRRRRKLITPFAFDPVRDWDGLCGHPSGLRTPWEMQQIAQAKMQAMEDHPGLDWLRREDDIARQTPIKRARRNNNCSRKYRI